MSTTDKHAPRDSAIYRLPIFGAIFRELTQNSAHFPLYVVLAVLALWAIAVAIWGLPALFLPAVVFSPIMLGILVLIGRG